MLFPIFRHAGDECLRGPKIAHVLFIWSGAEPRAYRQEVGAGGAYDGRVFDLGTFQSIENLSGSDFFCHLQELNATVTAYCICIGQGAGVTQLNWAETVQYTVHSFAGPACKATVPQLRYMLPSCIDQVLIPMTDVHDTITPSHVPMEIIPIPT